MQPQLPHSPQTVTKENHLLLKVFRNAPKCTKTSSNSTSTTSIITSITSDTRPAKDIDGIEVLQVNGLNRGSNGGNNEGSSTRSGSLADVIVNSTLRYRTQAPLLDGLMKEIDIFNGDIYGMTQGVNDAMVQNAKSALSANGASHDSRL